MRVRGRGEVYYIGRNVKDEFFKLKFKIKMVYTNFWISYLFIYLIIGIMFDKFWRYSVE